CSKIRDQLNLLIGKWPYLLAVDTNCANQFALLEHRHLQKTSRAAQIGCRNAKRVAVGVNLLGMCIDDMDSLLTGGDAAEPSPWVGADRSSVQIFIVCACEAEGCNRRVSAVIKAGTISRFWLRRSVSRSPGLPEKPVPVRPATN